VTLTHADKNADERWGKYLFLSAFVDVPWDKLALSPFPIDPAIETWLDKMSLWDGKLPGEIQMRLWDENG